MIRIMCRTHWNERRAIFFYSCKRRWITSDLWLSLKLQKKGRLFNEIAENLNGFWWKLHWSHMDRHRSHLTWPLIFDSTLSYRTHTSQSQPHFQNNPCTINIPIKTFTIYILLRKHSLRNLNRHFDAFGPLWVENWSNRMQSQYRRKCAIYTECINAFHLIVR